MAIINGRALRLTPTPAGAHALEQEMAPSVALLDGVIAAADPDRQIIALHAKGDLFQGAVVRMLSAIPPLPPKPTGDLLAAHDELVNATNEYVRPWRERAAAAYAEVARIAAEEPISKNPVVAYAVNDSVTQATATIATM
jgi:hypothetical protein